MGIRFSELIKMSREEFTRYCGVTKEAFHKIIQVVHKARIGKRGHKTKLLVPDQILLTLLYWREYRTFYHLGQDFGISESAAWRTVQRIEKILIECGEFSLPSKRNLYQERSDKITVVIDVVETEVERPKKNRVSTIAGSKNAIPLRRRLS
jgi:hypothetical protein